MTGQMIFDLTGDPVMGRDSFFVSPSNAGALALIDSWRNWPLGRMILTGPSGSGKTHLAEIWAQQTGAQRVAGADLARHSVPRLAQAGAVVLEEAHHSVGSVANETALFHLINELAQSNGTLLMTAQTGPRDWGMTLPDLISRVQATGTIRLDPPDDALLSAVLVKLLADRQLIVDPKLIPFLLSRMDRSFAFARELVDQMDRAALERQSAITVTLAASVLSTMLDERE